MGKIFIDSFDETSMSELDKFCWEHVLTPREIDSWRHAIQLDKRRREKCLEGKYTCYYQALDLTNKGDWEYDNPFCQYVFQEYGKKDCGKCIWVKLTGYHCRHERQTFIPYDVEKGIARLNRWAKKVKEGNLTFEGFTKEEIKKLVPEKIDSWEHAIDLELERHRIVKEGRADNYYRLCGALAFRRWHRGSPICQYVQQEFGEMLCEKCIWVTLTGKECDKHKQKYKVLQKLKNMITQGEEYTDA